MIRISTRTLLVVLAGALLALSSRGAPVGAIETTTFGLDVAEPSKDGRLHLEVKAGRSTSGQVRVWNKSDAPLALAVTVVSAEIDDAGKVSLGGDGKGVGWVSVEPERVELAPGQERLVEVRATAPRKIDDEVLAVAVQVEPAAIAGGEQPAVVQRLALTTYLEPDGDSLIASLGPFPWIALAVLVLVAAVALRAAAASRKRRRAADAVPVG